MKKTAAITMTSAIATIVATTVTTTVATAVATAVATTIATTIATSIIMSVIMAMTMEDEGVGLLKAVLHNLLGSTHVGSVDTGMGQKSLKPRGPKAACERWGGEEASLSCQVAILRFADGGSSQKGIRPVAEAHVTGKLRALRCGLHNRRGPHGCLGGATALAGPSAACHDDGRRIPSCMMTAAIEALPLA